MKRKDNYKYIYDETSVDFSRNLLKLNLERIEFDSNLI